MLQTLPPIPAPSGGTLTPHHAQRETGPARRNITFDCAADVWQKGIRVVVFTLSGLRNREFSPDFNAYQAEAIQEIQASLRKNPLKQDRILNEYRNLHTSLGFSNRNYPAASESLLEYLLKYQRLPHVNLLVDIYNLVSAKTRLALGAHDLTAISGNVHLRMTKGDENFQPLGTPEVKRARPGGYAYIDDANDVLCFLEVKQVEKTKITIRTTDALFIVQGNAETNALYVDSMANYLLTLTQRFCGGQERVLYRGLTFARESV